LEFRLLGPVEMYAGGSRIDAGSPKIRLLLAILLLAQQDAVAPESLARRLWDEDAPPKYIVSLQAYASRLRKRFEEFGEDLVSLPFVPGVGYRLRVPSENVDVLKFKALTDRGRKAATDGDPRAALELLTEARGLIRGKPLADLAGSWAQGARVDLQEQLLESALIRIRLQLQQGEPESVIGELRHLADRYRYDEGIAILLMRALHEAGRSADALAHFRVIDRRLRKDLGIEPHAPLVATNQMILIGRSDVGSAVSAGPAGLAAPTARDKDHGAPDSADVPAEPAAPNTLDADPPGFTGREDDLTQLSRQIAERLADGRTAVCVISGMPGAGKTTLALRLAYDLRAQGFCPDGAFQVPLHGHDDEQSASRPETSLRLLLGTLGLEPGSLQRADGLDHLAALWRRQTRDRRLLIVLDDASDASQIRPLIPKGPGGIVLVTSRHTMFGLADAIDHPLAILTAEEAGALFLSCSNLSADASDEAVDRVVRACSRLPLALAVAGGLTRAHPAWTAGDLADHLRDTDRSGSGNALSHELASAFETSYRQLTDMTRNVFRHLALHPGTYVEQRFTAALTGVGGEEADIALCTLVEQNLLIELGRHRYRFHDLLRSFASSKMRAEDPPDEPDRARDRLLHYCMVSAERAAALFHPYRHLQLPDAFEAEYQRWSEPVFADGRDAASWLDREYQVLRAVTEDAFARGRATDAALLVQQLAAFFDRRGHWRESIPLHESSLRTWIRLGDRGGQARSRGDLATAHWRLGQPDQALDEAEAALGLWRALGNGRGEAEANLQLGRAYNALHSPAQAAQCFEYAAVACAGFGDPTGEARGLYHLAAVLFDLGHYDDAVERARRALNLAESVGDVAVERNVAVNIGEFLRQRGRYAEALDYCRRALRLSEESGDPEIIAIVALNLGDVCSLAGDHASAEAPLKRALAIFTRLDVVAGIVNTLIVMQRVAQLENRLEAAELLHHQAADHADRIVDPLIAARLQMAAAELHRCRGERKAALAAYRHALRLAEAAHAFGEQASAHRGIGDLLVGEGDSDGARMHYEQAVSLLSTLKPDEAADLRRLLDSGLSSE
jgi:DNA-binding SARP family transcriptional activator/tetratricopeptide (TPR) repeat protein